MKKNSYRKLLVVFVILANPLFMGILFSLSPCLLFDDYYNYKRGLTPGHLDVLIGLFFAGFFVSSIIIAYLLVKMLWHDD